MNIKIKLLPLLLLSTSFVFAQDMEPIDPQPEKFENSPTYRHSIGSSLFMLGNFLEDSPEYILLNYGYQLTKKDKIFIEFNTWSYAEPLGTYGKSEEFYPGFVRATGVGLGYQRFHWKGLFTTVQATPFMKQYHDIDDNKTQQGFQLYLQLAAGYSFSFFKERLFVEPAYVLKYWPIDNNFPTDFAIIEKDASNYIFEPSLNVGLRF